MDFACVKINHYELHIQKLKFQITSSETEADTIGFNSLIISYRSHYLVNLENIRKIKKLKPYHGFNSEQL